MKVVSVIFLLVYLFILYAMFVMESKKKVKGILLAILTLIISLVVPYCIVTIPIVKKIAIVLGVIWLGSLFLSFYLGGLADLISRKLSSRFADFFFASRSIGYLIVPFFFGFLIIGPWII